MISEDLTNKRAQVTIDLMGSLAKAVDKFLEEGKAKEASDVADSLTMLIVKTFEVEAVNTMSESVDRASRQVSTRKHDLGELD
ncbi:MULTISPECIES: hypothetical protein [Arthrobacter]|uniref:Uncharacterized protein n=1 Tax=Arthrobacter terricola TaxID=2547396 RepID=A0A4R5KJA6_9MICC|nr:MULTISPECIES: hypothetical protein [Arthrobacter]MBT8161436.1 hypothetical protein [Arthrobacter sp. GN70]TDF95609.1 hypothetical protein E1809_11320 [Arthrobacter terricola]